MRFLLDLKKCLVRKVTLLTYPVDWLNSMSAQVVFRLSLETTALYQLSELYHLLVVTYPSRSAKVHYVLSRCSGDLTQVLLVSDTNVGPLYADDVVSALEAQGFRVVTHTIEAGEPSKSLETVSTLIDLALDSGLGRRDLIVALGGGVVGDIAGFTAAILHRGIALIQVPTTLLAQVDSAVGGKTGVNHAKGKNLVGAFWQPDAVVASHAVLATLPERERRCGLAEAIKHGFISDAALVDRFAEDGEAFARLEREPTMRLVEDCCRIKASIVAADERESGRRAVLNFGHTLGHAYERLLGYGELTHGEAVSLGMVHAARVSERIGSAAPGLAARVVEVLLRPCALFFFHKDSRMATEMVDAFEASLVKFVVASAEWR